MASMSDVVEIFEYDPSWKEEFAQIGRSIREALRESAVRIDHIGSTSIVGLGSKPIIDIQISVKLLEPTELFLQPIQSLGFVW